jgi:hypothetical protein
MNYPKNMLFYAGVALGVAGLGAAGALAGAELSTRTFLCGALPDVAGEARRATQLDAESKLLAESSTACDEIRHALIEGHITLPQAVDALRAENARRPATVRTRVNLFRGCTEEEHYAYQTLSYLNVALEEEDPARREAVLTRIRAELEEMLRSRPS